MLYLHFGDEREEQQWLESFNQQAPELKIVRAGDAIPLAEISWVAVWNPQPDFFKNFPNLQGVFALSAGVDALVARDDLPADIPIMRLVDAGMAEQMIDYILWVALTLQGDFDLYLERQRQLIWQAETSKTLAKPRIGILGLGSLGKKVALALKGLGYPVHGWKRTADQLEGVEILVGDEGLVQLLKQTDLLVNLLPNTPATQGLLNKQRLSKLPQGASLVNVGRGPQLVDEDLLSLLDSKHLRLAVLDVFTEEPLRLEPKVHPFWMHPQIIVTPHVAAYTLPNLAVEQVLGNLECLAKGKTPKGLVDLTVGY